MLESRDVPAAGLTTIFSQTGHLGAQVAAAAVGGSGSFSATLNLSDIPAETSIVKAIVQSVEYFGIGGASLTFGGASAGASSDAAGAGGLKVHTWDVTSLVSRGGTYAASVTGPGQGYGIALTVVYSSPTLPTRTVIVNTGASDISVGHHGPDSATANFAVPEAGAYTLWVFTGADNTTRPDMPRQSDEQVRFNGAVVGGPLDQNLGASASLIRTSVTAVAGNNVVEVTSQDDWFGWPLAVLVTDQPALTVATDAADYTEGSVATLTGKYLVSHLGANPAVVINWGDGTDPYEVPADRVANGQFTAKHFYIDDRKPSDPVVGNSTASDANQITVAATNSADPSKKAAAGATVTIHNAPPSKVDVVLRSPAILYAASNETSSNSWNRSVMRDSSPSA